MSFRKACRMAVPKKESCHYTAAPASSSIMLTFKEQFQQPKPCTGDTKLLLVALCMSDELLHRKQESYRILIESVKEYAVIILDPQGYVISWNKGAEMIKGYTADEIIGRHFSVFYTKVELAAGEPERNLQKAK